MSAVRATSKRLSTGDWTESAYQAFMEGGLDAVAVEPVAKRLGTTKGSFYWHFKDRGELVQAVLDRWLRGTEEIIDRLEGIDDPRHRLQELFGIVHHLSSWARAEIDLLGKVGDPRVSRAVREAGHRRLGFMAACLREIGLAEEEATDGALQAYALWVGLLQLTAAVPDLLPPAADARRFGEATGALFTRLFPAEPGGEDRGRRPTGDRRELPDAGHTEVRLAAGSGSS
ncbi:TetR/AcrR family transcriptional regulator [Rhizohabitans arisaemae]|uniref:TetR/AcrR family transcriptional regulator n=1 Tax=Rhizohabitans arisaemae TaxID=2720610 RepID=UPI0024B26D03|nr:TetR/AcrR family transcriptional regulator [Rhizohabitans arisaemae]